MLPSQLATQLLYRQDESLYHTVTKQKRSVVKVLSTLLCLPGFETQTQNEERPVRDYILQEGEEHENRERERGRVREQGVRDPQRLGLSQGIMIREQEYGGGAHPKYRSCRVVVSRILRASLEGVHTQ
jgi:hypothetical protein